MIAELAVLFASISITYTNSMKELYGHIYFSVYVSDDPSVQTKSFHSILLDVNVNPEISDIQHITIHKNVAESSIVCMFALKI